MAVMDTSVAIHILKNVELGKFILDNFKAELTATTSITLNEVLIGVREKDQQVATEFLKNFEVLSFDEKAAYKSVEIESKLNKKGAIIEKLDIFIASICLIKRIPLITTDKHFTRIEGLKVIIPEIKQAKDSHNNL